MVVSSEGSVVMCPYCGSSHLILESDDVTRDRIRGAVATQGYQFYRDVEMSKHNVELEKKRLETKEYTTLLKVILVVLFVSFALLWFL